MNKNTRIDTIEVTIPCGWCDKDVIVDEDHGQVVYCSEDHARANAYHGVDGEM